MEIKRIKKIAINCYTFDVTWDNTHSGGWFNYVNHEINIGTKNISENVMFMIICHEIMEIVAIEMNIRLKRPDCDSDYVFVYDHRQYETMMNMFAGIITKFIK